MEAFAFLHALANHNALRRIERPELPDAALDVLARGLARRQLVDGVMFAHLGAGRATRSWSRSSPTSCSRSRAPSGRSSPAASTASCTSRCATSATSGRAGEVVRDAFGDLGRRRRPSLDGQGRDPASRLAGGGPADRGAGDGRGRHEPLPGRAPRRARVVSGPGRTKRPRPCCTHRSCPVIEGRQAPWQPLGTAGRIPPAFSLPGFQTDLNPFRGGKNVDAALEKRQVERAYELYAPAYDFIFDWIFSPGRGGHPAPRPIPADDGSRGRHRHRAQHAALPAPCRLTGIDLSEEMLEKAVERPRSWPCPT